MGGAAFLKEAISGIIKLRAGKSATEGKRRLDIVAQRDEARANETALKADCAAHEKRADREAANRRALEEYVSQLRRFAIEHGHAIASLPVQPKLDLGSPA